MQTRGQSRLEVGIDVGLSLLVNIGVQVGFYGALATAGRSLAVAALVLTLAVPRRYGLRRLFNARLPAGARQPSWHAWVEVGADTVLGLLVAIGVQWVFYGPAATWAKAGGLTGVVYAITMCRRYLLRRLFERWSARQHRASLRHRSLPDKTSQEVPMEGALPQRSSEDLCARLGRLPS